MNEKKQYGRLIMIGNGITKLIEILFDLHIFEFLLFKYIAMINLINLDGLLGINATITSLFITLAFFLIDSTNKKENKFNWDIYVIFEQLLKIKWLIFNVVLITLPIIFWDTNFKWIIFLVYIFGLCNISKIMYACFRWITSSPDKKSKTTYKNYLRAEYLKNLKNEEDTIIAYESLLTENGWYNIQNIEIFSILEQQLPNIKKTNENLYIRLWTLLIREYTNALNKVEGQMYINDFLNIYFEEFKKIIPFSQDKTTVNPLFFTLKTVIESSFEIEDIYARVYTFEGKYYKLIGTLDIRQIQTIFRYHGSFFLNNQILHYIRQSKDFNLSKEIPSNWTFTLETIKDAMQKENENVSQVTFSNFAIVINLFTSLSDRPDNTVTMENPKDERIKPEESNEFRQVLFERFFPNSEPELAGRILSILEDINHYLILTSDIQKKRFWAIAIALGYRYNLSQRIYVYSATNFNNSFGESLQYRENETVRQQQEFLNVLIETKYYNRLLQKKLLCSIKEMIEHIHMDDSLRQEVFEDFFLVNFSDREKYIPKNEDEFYKHFEFQKKDMLDNLDFMIAKIKE